MILLTGAGGLLGSHILLEGLKQGLRFRCPVRTLKPRSYLAKNQDKVEVLQAVDLAASLPTDLCKDITTVIHAAAPTHGDVSQILNCTENLFRSATQTAHFIQVSSIAVLCDGSSTLPVTETHHTSARNTPYALAKQATDAWLEQQQDGPMRSIVYPTFMLGPWDSRPSSGGILLAMRMKRLTHFWEGTKNFVHPQEVARGILRIAEQPQAQKLILSGQDRKVSEFIDLVAPLLQMPKELFQLIEASTAIDSLPLAEQQMLKEFCSSSSVSCQKAEQAIQYKHEKTLEEMLEESVRYFREARMML